LNEITQRGHDIGNHSFKHESWLQRYTKDQLEKEIQEAEKFIFKATGKDTIGFRGPGFSWSPELMGVLEKRNYLFDASTLPTFVGPIARMYYFWKSDLSPEQMRDRKDLFGGFRNGTRPVKPYIWQVRPGHSILEIPVTTIPFVKTPFHLSYLLYLSRISLFLMDFYLNIAIYLCKVTGTTPSYLLHPLDLIGGDKLKSLSFFPGMDLSSKQKTLVFNRVIKTLEKNFNLVSMETFAQGLLKDKGLKVVCSKT
jgi:hypothetical protein